VDRNEYRVPYSAYFGAIPQVASKDKDDFKTRLAAVHAVAPFGVDVVVEVTGSPAVVPEGIKLLRFGGHYAFAGIHIPLLHTSVLHQSYDVL
jgi:threonine dehydrogenase-like Zn-dependent dehydrogenase